MKPTDFSVHVTSFLTHYLAAQRNVSPNTIKAYRDVFTLLLRFCRDVQGIAPEKLRLEQIDVSFVEAFLDYLERERKSSPRTRNQRLAALHAFFRYVQVEEPTRMHQCQKNPRDPAAETHSPNRQLPFQRRVGGDPGAARSPHARGSKRCGLAERTLRHGSACSGVGRSLRRRCAFGSTRADSPSGKGAQNARCAFDGKHGSASTQSHAGKPPRSSRTVRQASFPKRAPRATDPFGNSLHPSQIRRSGTKQVSEFKPNRKPAHAETYKGYAPVAERSLARHDPRLPRPRRC
jgi:hypothetical protein